MYDPESPKVSSQIKNIFFGSGGGEEEGQIAILCRWGTPVQSNFISLNWG